MSYDRSYEQRRRISPAPPRLSPPCVCARASPLPPRGGVIRQPPSRAATHAHTHTHTHTHTYTHTQFVCGYVHICIHTYVCSVCTHPHPHPHTHPEIHTWALYQRGRVSVCVYVCVCVCVYALFKQSTHSTRYREHILRHLGLTPVEEGEHALFEMVHKLLGLFRTSFRLLRNCGIRGSVVGRGLFSALLRIRHLLHHPSHACSVTSHVWCIIHACVHIL